MKHLHRHGYPVPEVFDVSGPDLVMERINGPTMLDAFGRRPWRVATWARTLADLTGQLTKMPLPDHDLPIVGDQAEVIVHLDLHPLNVMLTDRGPVVIDWTNAAIGPSGLDTADAWLVIAAAQVDGPLAQRLAAAAVRRLFLRRYLARSDTSTARTWLQTAFENRSSDPNLHAEELASMLSTVEAEAST